MRASSAPRRSFHRRSDTKPDAKRASLGDWFIAAVGATLRAGGFVATPEIFRPRNPTGHIPDAAGHSMSGSEQRIIDPKTIAMMATPASDAVYETDRLWWEELTRAERMR